MKSYRIGILAGSLRKESYCKKIAAAVIKMAPDDFRMEVVDISGLPIYNQDMDDEGAPPAQWTDFRSLIGSFDAFLFVTPEHNRSVPAALKNALDVASRPYGKSAWNGKPCAVISVSTGVTGAFGANHHLRQTLTYLNLSAMCQPEAYIGNAAALFGPGGDLINDKTRELLIRFTSAFVSYTSIRTAAPE